MTLYKPVRSEEEALDILKQHFSLPEENLHELAHALLGLPLPRTPLPRDPDLQGRENLPDAAPRVLGLVGYLRAGKDVVAAYLQRRYKDVARIAYSDPILSECNEFLAFYGHRIGESNKDDYRLFLQSWSMARRAEDENYWSYGLQEEIDRALGGGARMVVLSGARLPADVELIERNSGELWRVVRLGGRRSQHPNEAWIDSIRCSTTIQNSVEGDTGPLEEQVERALWGSK